MIAFPGVANEKMMTSDPLAEDITDDLLYKLGRALRDRSLDDIAACFECPQILETLAGKCLVETEDDVRHVFARKLDYFEERGITDVVRTILSAEFLSRNVIGSTFVSQLMCGDGTPFRAPYPTYAVIRKAEGRWRWSSSIHAILDDPEHAAALSGTVTSFRPQPDGGR